VVPFDKLATLERAINSVKNKKDPILKIYFTNLINQGGKDFIISSLLYFSAKNARVSRDFITADEKIAIFTSQAVFDGPNQTFDIPFAYTASIGNWLTYFEARKNRFWPIGDNYIQIYFSVAGSLFYPII
jgi:hypothetical protein